MNKLRILLLTISMLPLSSCETVDKSTLLGIGIGSVIGSAAGAASSHENSNKRAMVGAATGAAIGGLAGFLGHKEKPKQLSINRESSSEVGDIPSLTMPKIRRVWVPDQIKGKKLVKGHFIYIIEKEGQWRVNGK